MWYVTRFEGGFQGWIEAHGHLFRSVRFRTYTEARLWARTALRLLCPKPLVEAV